MKVGTTPFVQEPEAKEPDNPGGISGWSDDDNEEDGKKPYSWEEVLKIFFPKPRAGTCVICLVDTPGDHLWEKCDVYGCRCVEKYMHVVCLDSYIRDNASASLLCCPCCSSVWFEEK